MMDDSFRSKTLADYSIIVLTCQMTSDVNVDSCDVWWNNVRSIFDIV